MTQRAGWLLAAVAVAVAGWIAIDTFRAMIDNHVALPFWDAWRSVPEYRLWLAGDYGLDDLFSQHNEHRIAAGRVFFLADFIAFRGRGIFLSVCIGAILSGLAALLIWIGRPTEKTGWRGYAVVAAAVVGCCLTFAAFENLIWPFQVPFVLLYLSAVIGLYATMRSSEAAKAGETWVGWVVVACGALTVAAYCMANGLAAAGLAVVLAICLRAPWRLAAILGALFVVLAVSYFHGYVAAPNTGGAAYLTAHPAALPTYGLMFVGNILRDYAPRETTTLLLGAVGMALCVGIAWRIAVRRDLEPTRLMLTALLLFLLASGLASGLGRIGASGVSQALVPRYVTPGALFWAAQALYWRSASLGWTAPWARALPVAGAAALLLLLAGAQVGARKDAAGLWASMSQEADALLAGVYDSEAQSASTPFARFVPADVATLRLHNKSIFAEPQAHWMGRPMAAVARAGGVCQGAIDFAARAPNDQRGLRVTGWAWDLEDDERIERLLIVDAAGRIVGLGSGGSYRPDVDDVIPAVDHVASGWRGFAAGNPGEPLSVFGLVGNKRACLIGKTTATP